MEEKHEYVSSLSFFTPEQWDLIDEVSNYLDDMAGDGRIMQEKGSAKVKDYPCAACVGVHMDYIIRKNRDKFKVRHHTGETVNLEKYSVVWGPHRLRLALGLDRTEVLWNRFREELAREVFRVTDNRPHTEQMDPFGCSKWDGCEGRPGQKLSYACESFSRRMLDLQSDLVRYENDKERQVELEEHTHGRAHRVP